MVPAPWFCFHCAAATHVLWNLLKHLCGHQNEKAGWRGEHCTQTRYSDPGAPGGGAAGPGSAIWWQNPPEELDRLQNVLAEARATPLSR